MIVTNNVSCHWYYPDGKRCFEVPYADPSKGMRPTTLRDARKLGLVPSVTTILRALDKPALNNWRIEQAVLSVLTAPRLAGEATDAFVKRVLQVDREQDAESVKAMELGSDIHAAIESALSDEPYSGSLRAFVEPVVALVRSFGSVVATERVVVGDGYAGTTDALTYGGPQVIVWDFKTAKTLPTSSWPEARLQLSAYAQTIGNTGSSHIRTANIYISTTEPGKIAMFEHSDWLNTYLSGFKPLLQVWRWLNNMPAGDTPSCLVTEQTMRDLLAPGFAASSIVARTELEQIDDAIQRMRKAVAECNERDYEKAQADLQRSRPN
jgi:hypothetical protein